MNKRRRNRASYLLSYAQALLCVVALLGMLGIGVYSMLDADQLLSKSEKRTLAVKPEISFKSLFDGSFANAFDDYYSDQFPQREWLLEQNRSMNRFYSYSVERENQAVLVMANHDGISNGGESLSHPAVQAKPQATLPTVSVIEPTEPTAVEETSEHGLTNDDITVTNGDVVLIADRAIEVVNRDDEVLEDYAATLNHIAEAMGEDVHVYSVIVPNSAEFYSPEDLHTGEHGQKAMIEDCYGMMNDNVSKVDAYGAIEKHLDEYVYFRTDHHWTGRGAYYAYTAFCKNAGLNPIAMNRFQSGTYDGFLGTLYYATSGYEQSRILEENPDTVTYYRPVAETAMTYYLDADGSYGYEDLRVISEVDEDTDNKYLCFLGGDHPITWINTDVNNDRVCVVVKESYGNAFMTFLTNHYRTVIGIDSREFNRDGKPDLDLVTFAKNAGATDMIIINYTIAVNNVYMMRWLGRLFDFVAE